MSENRSLRILHLTAGSDLGGVSRYLHDLTAGLQSQGHQITLAGQKGAWHDLFQTPSIHWIDLPLKGGFVDLLHSVNILNKQLEAKPFDLIHAHCRKAAWVGRRLAKRFDLPLLFTLHLTGIPMKGPWRWLSDFGDHTHVPSAMAKTWLSYATTLKAQAITVIPHGVDTTRFAYCDNAGQQAARQQLGLPDDQLVAAFVGRFETPKNEQWVVDVAAQAALQKKPILFVLLGQGPGEAALRKKVAAQGLSKHIRILAYQDPLPIYQACDALLLPSALEGFSYVCLEAMSVGRPVLRTQTAGTQELIIEKVTGQSVPIVRQQFVDAAIAFLADRTHLKQLGKQAASHVQSHFTFDQQLQKTLTLYHQQIAVLPKSS